MKKLLLLLFVSAPVWAGTVYRQGNQFPATCGSSGLVLAANGDCTSSWITAPPPTGLLVSTNTWTARQNFNGFATFGADGLEINAAGEFKSPANAFDFLTSGNKFMMRVATIGTCYADHVANCQDLELGRSADGFAGELQAFISSQYGTTLERFSIQSQKMIITPEGYNTERFGNFMLIARNESTQDGSNNNNVVFAVQASTGQAVDLTQTLDQLGNVFTRTTLTGGTGFTSKTKAALQALAPEVVGETYYCSDCSTDALVVSTGTATGAFARVSARTTAIN